MNALAIILGALIAIGILCIVLAYMFSGPLNSKLDSLGPLSKGKDKIAVVYIDGQMVADKGSNNGDAACSGDIVKNLREATDDKNVKAIVLRVNTPGGTPVAAEEIISQINRTRATKPIVVSMGDMATSAGYFVASNADRIVANPDTFTGSIGVIWVFKNKSKLYRDEGVNYYVAKSGNFKDLGSEWRGLSEDEKGYVQSIINESYSRFVTSVAKGRNLSVEYVREIADGRVYTGSKAKDMGLVDELGGLYDAVNVAANLSGVKGKPEIIYMNEKTEKKAE
jgi:protease-4